MAVDASHQETERHMMNGLHRRGVREARKYMVQNALDRGYTVVGVCRERSVGKLDDFKGRITVTEGQTK